MRICENGRIRELTAEEMRSAREHALRDRSRPLSEGEVLALLIPGVINTAQVDDNTALRMTGYYPRRASGTEYTTGWRSWWDLMLRRCFYGKWHILS